MKTREEILEDLNNSNNKKVRLYKLLAYRDTGAIDNETFVKIVKDDMLLAGDDIIYIENLIKDANKNASLTELFKTIRLILIGGLSTVNDTNIDQSNNGIRPLTVEEIEALNNIPEVILNDIETAIISTIDSFVNSNIDEVTDEQNKETVEQVKSSIEDMDEILNNTKTSSDDSDIDAEKDNTVDEDVSVFSKSPTLGMKVAGAIATVAVMGFAGYKLFSDGELVVIEE